MFRDPTKLLVVNFSWMFVFCTAWGCSDGRPARVPVSGRVVIDGQPVTTGSIRFSPESGRPAVSAISSDGRFELRTFEDGDGCVPGSHRVSVLAYKETPSEVQWFVPKKYANPTQSGLIENIEQATDSLLIELTWAGKTGPEIEKTGASMTVGAD
jgi:hypothetical protein